MQTILEYANLLIELSGALALTSTVLAKLLVRFPKASEFFAHLGHNLGAAKDALAKRSKGSDA